MRKVEYIEVYAEYDVFWSLNQHTYVLQQIPNTHHIENKKVLVRIRRHGIAEMGRGLHVAMGDLFKLIPAPDSFPHFSKFVLF